MAKASFPDLAGASVFITGGASGIGGALTRGFAEQGARVTFVDLLEPQSPCDAVEEATGNRPLGLQCDVTDDDALRGAVNRATEAHGAPRVLVNCAALDDRHKTEQVDAAYWTRMMDINLRSYFFAGQAVLPGMVASGGGAIVNFSSISYMIGMHDYPLYVAANAGITGLTRGWAREFGPRGVRVNGIAPGWVLTERQKALWATPESLAAMRDRQCLKRHLDPEDIVAPVLFLSSQASEMMTGQVMAVDGGVVTVAA